MDTQWNWHDSGILSELQREQRKANLKKSRERSLNLIKSALDIVVAVGLLQLAPRTVNARVTGGLGFITSAISCYQVLFQIVCLLCDSLCNVCKYLWDVEF